MVSAPWCHTHYYPRMQIECVTCFKQCGKGDRISPVWLGYIMWRKSCDHVTSFKTPVWKTWARDSPAYRSKWPCWRSHESRNWHLKPEGRLQSTASKKLGSTVLLLQGKKLLPTNWGSLEADSSPIKSLNENAAQLMPWLQLGEDLSRGAGLSSTWTPNPQKLWDNSIHMLF